MTSNRIAKAKSSVNAAFGPDYVSSPSLPRQQRKQWLALTGVAVEKLDLSKLVEKTLR
jgi:hypothetical protein